MYDVIITNGTIVDGTGARGFKGDVAIKNGRIAAVGKVDGTAKRTIDAAGRIVAPGFIDPHTHFDVQILWDGAARPALEHGVTTIVPGNCSLSLAPLKASDRKAVVGMFQQIEEMPPEAFTQAFTWTWEDFAGYRKAIEPGLSLNVAPLVGHSLIRLWVMGEASQQRAATPDEIAQMQDLLRESLKAGGVGLSTSYIDVDENGRPVPSRFAQFDELDALCEVLGEFGRILQVVPEFYDADLTIARIDQLAELSLKHNIPTTFSPVFDSPATPKNSPRIVARVEEQFARGARVWPQMQTRPVDISFSFLRPSLYFARLPTWWRTLRQPLEQRNASLRDKEVVAKMLAEADTNMMTQGMGILVIRGGDNAPAGYVGRTLAEVAKERGETNSQALINVSLENDLDVAFLAENVGHADTSRIGPMLAKPSVHIGASDGGAHITSFSTYGDTGFLFSEFVRKSGDLTLEQAVKKITSDTAEIWGLADRGRLAPEMAADVVVFDAATIGRGAERAVFDMPGDGMRYVRSATGIDTVLVNGEVAYAAGDYTAAKAGVVCV
ncbi:MAG: amidohydrolase family protein [Alphaproteobacteria bacterium]|nr:amidohydrolase family protein [Alphaproteobacteria bacterium]